MSYRKLIQLSQSTSPSPSVKRLRGAIAELQSLPIEEEEKGSVELLDIPFDEWVKQIRIKSSEGVRNFDPFVWQSDFVKLLLDNPRIPITLLSSRQTGKTPNLLAVVIYLCLSIEQFSALIVHRKGEDARLLARRVKRMIPDNVKLTSDSLSLIEFSGTSSVIHFRSSNHRQQEGAESTARGLEQLDLIILEEASHSNNVAEVLGVCAPCMTHSQMANIVLVGTSGRRESYFYETLVDSFGGTENLEGTLSLIRAGELPPYQVCRSANKIGVITNWRAIPKFAAEGMDEAGYPKYLTRIQREQDLSSSQISSEHELFFDSDTTSSVFDFALVKQAERGDWEPPSDALQYYAGVDGSGKPRPGRKGDYTTLVVVALSYDGSCKVVKLYRKRGITFERRYAEICEILDEYSPVLTLVEANDGLGQTYHENLVKGCPGLEIDRFINNVQRKSLAINKIDLGLERGMLSIPKSPIIDELLSFQISEDGKMGAIGKDSHDDCVMGLGMALVSCDFNPVKRYPDIPAGTL